MSTDADEMQQRIDELDAQVMELTKERDTLRHAIESMVEAVVGTRLVDGYLLRLKWKEP